jgi:hypothetical protein
MSEPIFSPDGKWMWSGSEWIPAPPSSPTVNTAEVKLQDSVISGDVSVNSTTIVESVDAKVVEAAMTGVKSIVSDIARDNDVLYGWKFYAYVNGDDKETISISRTDLRSEVTKIIHGGGYFTIAPPPSHFKETYQGVLTEDQINIGPAFISFEISEKTVIVSNNLPGTMVEYSAVSLETNIDKEYVLALVDGLLAKEYSLFKSLNWRPESNRIWCPYGEFPSLEKLYRYERNKIWWEDKEHKYAEEPLWIRLLAFSFMIGCFSFVGIMFFA